MLKAFVRGLECQFPLPVTIRQWTSTESQHSMDRVRGRIGTREGSFFTIVYSLIVDSDGTSKA